MPPAPRNVVTTEAIAELTSKIPFHVINMKDFKCSDIKNADKYRMILDLTRTSPEEISIKRTRNTLSVEVKRDHGEEIITRDYEIPEEGYTEEFAETVSSDGIITIRGLEPGGRSGNPIPIHLDRQPRKRRTLIRLNPSGYCRASIPIDFSAPTNYDEDVQRPKDDSVEQVDNVERNEEAENVENEGNHEENAEMDHQDIPLDDQRVASEKSP